MRNQMMLVKKGGRICEKFHFLTEVRYGREVSVLEYIFFSPPPQSWVSKCLLQAFL